MAAVEVGTAGRLVAVADMQAALGMVAVVGSRPAVDSRLAVDMVGLLAVGAAA